MARSPTASVPFRSLRSALSEVNGRAPKSLLAAPVSASPGHCGLGQVVGARSGGTKIGQRFTGLWRHPDFLKLWASQTVSQLGSHVGALALPLVAVLTLDASAFEVAVLNAAVWAPYLLVTLVAGAWVDRRRRRPILIVSDLGRAGVLATVPLAYALGVLRIELLYAIAFLNGALTVLFNLAYPAYLPTLVGRDHVLEGNSKLALSSSVTELGGPSLGGALVQLASAPTAVLVDAVSFVVSALGLWRIRAAEPTPTRAEVGQGLWDEIRTGLRLTFSHQYLRAIAGMAATYNLFEQVILALFVVYATRELGIGPALLGIIMAVGSAGGLLGALTASRLVARLGFGRALIGAVIVECAALLLIPLASGTKPIVVACLSGAFGFNGFGLALSNVYVGSLRQAITPDALLGRVLASYTLFSLGAIPVGALLAGVLQGVIGLRATLAVGAAGVLLAIAWLAGAGLGRLRELPASSQIASSTGAEAGA